MFYCFLIILVIRYMMFNVLLKIAYFEDICRDYHLARNTDSLNSNYKTAKI